MKIFLTAVFILGLSVSAIAADTPALNDDTINMFIEVFPQYKTIAEKYSENVNDFTAVPTSLQFKAEIDQLLASHGSNLENFTLLLHKIATGMTVIKLKESNMPNMLPGLQQFSTASEDELSTIEKHLTKLEELFETE